MPDSLRGRAGLVVVQLYSGRSEGQQRILHQGQYTEQLASTNDTESEAGEGVYTVTIH